MSRLRALGWVKPASSSAPSYSGSGRPSGSGGSGGGSSSLSPSSANAANAKKNELNQDDFLTLMITQLKNQDPFKPMDPAQYVGQLAQFSSVSGLSDMNKNITALTSSLRGNQVLDGAAGGPGETGPREVANVVLHDPRVVR